MAERREDLGCYEYAESLISYTGESKSSSQERSTMLKVLTTIEDKLCRIPFPGGAQKKYQNTSFFPPSLCHSFNSEYLVRTTIFFFSITILQIIQLSVYEYYLIGILQMPKVISFNENFVFILLFFTCVILVFRIKRTSSKSLISKPDTRFNILQDLRGLCS
ncbi:unnamed protein product [Lepeophtheirus salmonis]|uniref:(salmon louse) hypothetical protein n=1 Tax=Lepeophtheirus salmonis TaxID=72036 RepID=A0A7R8D4U6_LEPSM|nr:unnamed protein product [Lepeophtheirus salmonis]CAF3029341.1 unnamed protein product [Lepeophtheirus salmonis]